MIQRLDKYLADAGLGTRKEIRHFAVSKRITVNGVVERDVSKKADFSLSNVEFDGVRVIQKRTVLCVMNKPAGYVTSTDDYSNRTVMELVPEEYRKMGVVPVGRLDKDTEGVLLFSNDGELIHKLISPKNCIPKTYYAVFENKCPENAVELFRGGIELKDGSKCKSALFEKLSETEFRLTITEGMYHQVKRMAAAVGMHISYLRRDNFAGITCEGLESGGFREVGYSILTV